MVTYSKNVFLPVTNLCRNRCGYCGFRRPLEQAHLISRPEVVDILSKGRRAGCSEALISMGDRPWEVAGSSRFLGTRESLLAYVVEICQRALDHGLLPHCNLGLLTAEELDMMAPWNASMGLMLETIAPSPLHLDCPGKDPNSRLRMMAYAGRKKIPFTTGILVGIGEDWSQRLRSLKAIARMAVRFDHIQEVILQPLDPKPGTPSESMARPSVKDMIRLVEMARQILPQDVSIQVPPNLLDPKPLLERGADDLGGISSVTPDWINPNRPWPTLEELIKGWKLRERLPVYPKYVTRGWFGKETENVVAQLADGEGFRA